MTRIFQHISLAFCFPYTVATRHVSIYKHSMHIEKTRHNKMSIIALCYRLASTDIPLTTLFQECLKWHAEPLSTGTAEPQTNILPIPGWPVVRKNTNSKCAILIANASHDNNGIVLEHAHTSVYNQLIVHTINLNVPCSPTLSLMERDCAFLSRGGGGKQGSRLGIITVSMHG